MNLLQSSYIVHSRPYRETSLILDLFSREEGRISVIARGIKKNKASCGLLNPFQKLQVNISARGSLRNLNHLEAAGPANCLTQLSLYCGYYINELLLKVLPSDVACETLFTAYEFALSNLAQLSNDQRNGQESCLREFEFSLLSEMGKPLEFATESSSGKPILPEQIYWIGFDHGISTKSIEGALKFKGSTLLSIAGGEWHRDALKGAKIINRYFVDRLLNAKTLHSRKMARDYIEVMSEQSSSWG